MTGKNKIDKSALYAALLHYPVLNKKGGIIGTSITNLDLHDLSRTSATYGIKKLFMITPFNEQNKLLERIVEHWTKGEGGKKNPLRARALNIVQVVNTFEEAITEIERSENNKPLIISTAARNIEGNTTFKKLRNRISGISTPVLLVFGTGWGIADEILNQSDIILEPIYGQKEYNHLSVRCASAIIMDRLFGKK